jgi:hypothetical protein
MPEPTDDAFPRGFSQHRAEQIIFIAAHSTAEQRLEWLESMLELGTMAREWITKKHSITKT